MKDGRIWGEAMGGITAELTQTYGRVEGEAAMCFKEGGLKAGVSASMYEATLALGVNLATFNVSVGSRST